MQPYCFFCWAVLLFSLMLEKHYKIGFFDDFDMLIFSFLGQNFKVNSLATSRSITWPHFGPNFAQTCGQVIDLEVFTCFFVKPCFFFEKSHSPCRKKNLFGNKTTTNEKNEIKVAKLLTYGGQVIDPTAHIYIYIYLSLSLSLSDTSTKSTFFCNGNGRLRLV